MIRMPWEQFKENYLQIAWVESDVITQLWAFKPDCPADYKAEYLQGLKFSADEIPDILKHHYEIFDPYTKAGRLQQSVVVDFAQTIECEW